MADDVVYLGDQLMCPPDGSCDCDEHAPKWTRRDYEDYWHDRGHWNCRPCVLGPIEWVFLVMAVYGTEDTP